ncbi:hypothetical protein MKEN_01320200 [Mycena kentingensis (nom. inval.)]|nr:hypothetical protein MKEN_01320200 [Mycena kentingensis (nom. inval.)]
MAIDNPGIDLIVGPVLLGIIINTFIFGLITQQAVAYYTRPGRSEALVIRNYTIVHFGDVAFLHTTPWPYPMTPILSSLASVPVQIYLSWRAAALMKSYIYFGILSTLSLVAGALAFATAIKGYQASNIADFAALTPIVDGWLALSAACDIFLTLLLFLFLRRNRTGFKRTDHIITRLIRQSVETASVNTLVSIIDLITFTVMPNTNFHFVFALVAGRLYTMTLLTTINSRQAMREDTVSTHSGSRGLSSGHIHNQIPVHVAPSASLGALTPFWVNVQISVDRHHDRSQQNIELNAYRPTHSDSESKVNYTIRPAGHIV